MKLHLQWIKTLLHKPNKYIALRRYSIFKELSSFELYLLNNFMHHRSYKSGELLFDKGYPLEVIFFIEKGEIEVLGNTHSQSSVKLGKNQFIGLIDMFYESTRSSQAVAQTDVEAVAISCSDFMDLLKSNPRMGTKILTGVCKSFSNTIFHLSNPNEKSDEAK